MCDNITKNERMLRKEVNRCLLEALVGDDKMNQATYTALLRELDVMYELGAEKYYERTGYESIIGCVCTGTMDDPKTRELLLKARSLR